MVMDTNYQAGSTNTKAKTLAAERAAASRRVLSGKRRGHAEAIVQGNLAILPKAFRADFARSCQLTPQALPAARQAPSLVTGDATLGEGSRHSVTRHPRYRGCGGRASWSRTLHDLMKVVARTTWVSFGAGLPPFPSRALIDSGWKSATRP